MKLFCYAAKNIMSPVYPKYRPISDFFSILLCDLRGDQVRPIKIGCSHVKKSKKSIKIILIHRKSIISPFYPKSWPIFDFFPILLCDLRGAQVRSIKKGCSYVKKPKESIEIILLRRKNHYEPVLPQISTNIWFFSNFSLWFEKRLSAANENGAISCKKVRR